jgi:neprilysin
MIVAFVRNYALWRVAMEFVPHLSSAYLEARANFHKVLMGISQQRARWQQCIDYVNDKMGMATGAMFIRDHFQPESKDKVCILTFTD